MRRFRPGLALSALPAESYGLARSGASREGRYDDSHQVTYQDKAYYDDVQNTRITDNTYDLGDQYGYDGAKRLVTVLRGVETADIGTALATNLTNGDYDDEVVYTYDQTGNRTTLEVTPQGGSTATTTYAHNTVNEMTTEDGATLTYSANGAYTGSSADSNTFSYNADDQLARYEDGSDTWNFKFDGLGRRIQRKRSGFLEPQIRFYYDGIHCVEQVEKSSPTESLTKSFVYGSGIDELLEYVNRTPNPDVPYYVHADRLGSVMLLVDANGAIEEGYRYGEFGSTVIVDDTFAEVTVDPHDSLVGNPYRLIGLRQDIMIDASVAANDWYFARALNLQTARSRFAQRVAHPTSSAGPLFDVLLFAWCVQNPDHPICRGSSNGPSSGGGQSGIPGNGCKNVPALAGWSCPKLTNNGCKFTITTKEKPVNPDKYPDCEGGKVVDVTVKVVCGPDDGVQTECTKKYENVCASGETDLGPMTCGGETFTVGLKGSQNWGGYGTGELEDCQDELDVNCNP